MDCGDHAYTSPIPLDKSDAVLTRAYETSTRNVSRSQAALAAARLANVINAGLL